jgi:pimeloyl-ACP methyl ester carboxylesterase
VQGHWRLYKVVTGTVQTRAAITARPLTAQLMSSMGTVKACPKAQEIGTRTPVILIHGFDGNPSIWGSDSDPGSMFYTADMIRGTWTTAFDYSQFSKEWVTNPQIGPRLRDYVECVAKASQAGGGPGKVIIVAHSMGGLATRWAANNGARNDIALVVTLGTPNTGAFLANAGAIVHHMICTNSRFSLMSMGVSPGSPAPGSFCAEWTSLAGMSVFGSQINALPELPSNIPLYAIAGDETIEDPLGGAIIYVPLFGDFVVLKSSALNKRPTGGPGSDTTIACHGLDPFGSCWHVALTRNQVAEQEVHDLIYAYVQSHPGQAAQPTQSSSAAYWLAGGGRWYVHGIALQISQGPSGLTGTETWNEGPCDPANLPGVMCEGSASLAFTSQANGSLAGTYTTNTTYTPWSGTTVGNFPGDPGAPQKGQTVLLEPIAPMHAQSVLGPDSPMMFSGGNLNWCQQGLADASQYCGA